MIPKLLTSSLAAGAAALGVAASAQAATLPVPSDPAFAVPQGKVEHTIVEQRVSGSKAVASRTRTETWLTATRSHTLVYDAATVKLTAETSSTPTEVRAWTAEDGVIQVERRKKPGALIENSTAFEAAVQKAYIEQGITRVIGETTVGGRRALITESVPENWRTDEPSQRTTAVVDALTYALYSRTSTLPNGVFTQTQTWRSELLGAARSSVRAKMAMKGTSSHPPITISCPTGLKVADLLATEGAGVGTQYARETVVGSSDRARIEFAPRARVRHGHAGHRAVRVRYTYLHVSPGGPIRGSVGLGQPLTLLGQARDGYVRVLTDQRVHGWVAASALR